MFYTRKIILQRVFRMPKTTEKRNSNPLGGFLAYLLSIILSVTVIVYLGYHFLSGLGDELNTEFALMITENDVTEFDAYVFRNETVVYSTNAGGVGYIFPDGTKVNSGADIAQIYGSVGHNEETRNEIIAIDREIELLTQSNSTDGLAASDTQTIDNRIYSYYMTIRRNAEQGVYTSLPKRRDEFLTLINKRQVITGKVQNYNSVIEDLQHQREYLTAGLDSVNETVTAPATGFFYSSLDGYESVFTPDALTGLTLDRFDSMVQTEPRSYSASAIGKIATDFRWYIAMEADREDLRFYQEGYSYRVIFPYNNDTQLTMKLSDIVSHDGSKRILLVFTSHEIPDDFSFLRMQTVKVVRNSYTGYKVPISSVRLMDGQKGVFILVGKTVEFRYIDIILECDGYYIVAPRDPQNDPDFAKKLGLYDVIITGGRNLHVGKIIS